MVTGVGHAIAVNKGSGSASAHTGPVKADPSTDTLTRIDELLGALAGAARASLESGTQAAAVRGGAPDLPPDQAEVIIEESERLTAELRRPRRSSDHIGLALRNLLRAATPVLSLLTQANEAKNLIEGLLH